MKYLIGNWKSNKTTEEAESWIEQVKKAALLANPKLTVVLCPAYTQLMLFKNNYPELTLGVQTLSPYPDGTYTGAVSARMLDGIANFAILGHSERRGHFGETDQVVARQVEQAMSEQMTPIVAVDKSNWGQQLSQFRKDQLEKMIVMYEPPEAISEAVGPIGEGEAAEIDEVVEAIEIIREETSPMAVIYGGSVKANNIQEFLGHDKIDGVLPGSASLDAQEWVRMVRLANQIVS